jgi:hypothetical protein
VRIIETVRDVLDTIYGRVTIPTRVVGTLRQKITVSGRSIEIMRRQIGKVYLNIANIRCVIEISWSSIGMISPKVYEI